MLPSSGYFKSINCPYFKNGFCCRPHCHYKHEVNQKVVYIPTPMVKSIPEYKPTPICKLKKLKTSNSLKSSTVSQNLNEQALGKLEENNKVIKTDGQETDKNIDETVNKNDSKKKILIDDTQLPRKSDSIKTSSQRLEKLNDIESLPSSKPIKTKSQLIAKKEELRKTIYSSKISCPNLKLSKNLDSKINPNQAKDVKNIKQGENLKLKSEDKVEVKNTLKKSSEDLKRKHVSVKNEVQVSSEILTKKKRIAHESAIDKGFCSKTLVNKGNKLSPVQVMFNRFISSCSKSSETDTKNTSLTISQSNTTLGKKRVAHKTSIQASHAKILNSNSSLSKSRPVMPLELGSKIPLILRKRYLNNIIDELLKFCKEEEAFERSLNEEKTIYLRSSSKNIYLNLAVNLIKRIRNEFQSKKSETTLVQKVGIKTEKIFSNQNLRSEKEENRDSKSDMYNYNKKVSHQDILNGPHGQSCTIVPKKPCKKLEELNNIELYHCLIKLTLSPSQMVQYGYPLMNFNDYGSVYIPNLENKIKNYNPNQNICCRCNKSFTVNESGIPTNTEPCVYHSGRLWSERFNHSTEKIYSCCKCDSNSDGCCSATYHVFDGSLHPSAFKGYVSPPIYSYHPSIFYGIFAIDCEMCYTTIGLELTRVTVVDHKFSIIYESLVKPRNPIIDYNTKFSGIKDGDLDNVDVSLEDVQRNLLTLINGRSILIGHSLESDLKSLKIVHGTVIDTAALFPHRRGLPYKRGLKNLMAEFLKSIIQDEITGHDSHEDAVSCMKLVLWKLSQNLPKYLDP